MPSYRVTWSVIVVSTSQKSARKIAREEIRANANEDLDYLFTVKEIKEPNVAKCTTIQVPTVRLDLTTNEASWLMSLLNGAITSDNSPDVELPGDKVMRENIFIALKNRDK